MADIISEKAAIVAGFIASHFPVTLEEHSQWKIAQAEMHGSNGSEANHLPSADQVLSGDHEPGQAGGSTEPDRKQDKGATPNKSINQNPAVQQPAEPPFIPFGGR